MKHHVVACAAAIMLAAAPVADASFMGGTVNVRYDFPSTNTQFFNGGTAVVGPGVEFNNLGNFGVGVGPAMDIDSSSIMLTYPSGFTLAVPSTFDGWVVRDVGGTIPDFVGVSVLSTNIAGLTAAALSFDSNAIRINQSGLGPVFGPGAFLRVGVSFRGVAVPEPGTLALLGFGLAAVALGRRRGLVARPFARLRAGK